MAMAEASFGASVMVRWLSMMVAKCDRCDMVVPGKKTLYWDNYVYENIVIKLFGI